MSEAKEHDQEDERTYTVWFNNILSLGGHATDEVTSLQNDLKDGVKLIQLLETLMSKNFKYDKQPKITAQELANLEIFFEQLKKAKIDYGTIGKPILSIIILLW